MKRVIILLFCIIFMLLSSSVWAKGKQDKYVSGEVLIKFRDSASRESKSRSLHSSKSHSEIKRSGIHHLKLKKGETVQSAIDNYLADPDIEFAEPNYYRTVDAVPNDTHFSKQWALESTGGTLSIPGGTIALVADADIDATDAWNIVTGASTVVVAVLDTGVDVGHADLAANIWNNIADSCTGGVDNDSNGFVDDCKGWNFVDNNNSTVDHYGHGTNVAGVLGAVGNNNQGISGVAQSVSIMPLKVINNSGIGTVADIIAGVTYAKDNGAKVLNASFGGYDWSYPEYAVFKAYCESGGVVVASTGNDALSVDTHPNYPSGYDLDCIVAVAASSKDDELSSYSNYGTKSVDLAAPGDYIYTTRHSRGVVWSDNFDDADISDWTPMFNNNWVASLGALKYSSSGTTPSRMYSPSIDLTSHLACGLYFDLDYTLGANKLYVEANGSGAWGRLLIYTGSSGGVVSVSYSLKNYIGGTVNIGFQTNSSTAASSISIDNVEVRCSTALGGTGDYEFVNGTSFSAPLVSGAAALLIAQEPTIESWDTAWRVKFSSDFKNSVSSTKSLYASTLSGGRLNARRVLIPYPTNFSATAQGNNAASMIWTDRTTDEDGFIVERDIYGMGNFVQLASLPPNTTFYYDNTFVNGNRYSYRVRTLRGGQLSAYSNNYILPPLPSLPFTGNGGGGCFIATAAYGTPMASEIVVLKRFRDEYLYPSKLGQAFIAMYYRYSPALAAQLRMHPDLRAAVRVALVPVVQAAKRPVQSAFGSVGFVVFMVIYTIRRKRRQK
jgi:subtilisin family serine protease